MVVHKKLIDRIREVVKQSKLKLHIFYSREKPNERKFSLSSDVPKIHDAKGKWCILPDQASCQQLFDACDYFKKGVLEMDPLGKALTEVTVIPLKTKMLKLVMVALCEPGKQNVDITDFVNIYHYLLKVKTIFEDLKSHGASVASAAMMEPLVDNDSEEAKNLFKYLKRSVKHFSYEGFLTSCLRYKAMSRTWARQQKATPIEIPNGFSDLWNGA